MGRPSNAAIERQMDEAIEEARHGLWNDLIDMEHAALPVVRSTKVDRAIRLQAAARVALIREIQEELNDSTSDLVVSADTVKELIGSKG